MKDRLLASLAGLIVLTLTVNAAAQTRPAPPRTAPALKTWTPPKTPWGDPDLQGTWTSDNCIGTPMQRPVNLGEKLYLTDEDIAQRELALAKQAENDKQEFVAPGARVGVGPPGHWGERARRPCKQTSLIVDPPNGRIPALTAEARTRPVPQGAGNDNPHPASWEDFSFYIRCITRGVTGSIFPVIYGNGAQIIQGPGFVTILHEMVHEARVIPLDGRPHAGPNIRTYMGDSRGHWEGNTLVIETTNFLADKTGIGLNGGGTPTSDALKLTERYTRADPNTINYEVTINDPKTYTEPWKVAFSITQEPGYQNFEYACHEGNYAMFNSLSGARAEDKAAEEAAKKK
jgi:hypothetical protein